MMIEIPGIPSDSSDDPGMQEALIRSLELSLGIPPINVEVGGSGDDLCGVANNDRRRLYNSDLSSKRKILAAEPTSVPTSQPTATYRPTVFPTCRPTVSPTLAPTTGPTEAIRPTVSPIQEGRAGYVTIQLGIGMNSPDQAGAEVFEAELSSQLDETVESGRFSNALITAADEYGLVGGAIFNAEALLGIDEMREAQVVIGERDIVSAPTSMPTSSAPTSIPTRAPITSRPSREGESNFPTSKPSSSSPTGQPTSHPTSQPTRQPSSQPSSQPTSPTSMPTGVPTEFGYIEEHIEDSFYIALSVGIFITGSLFVYGIFAWYKMIEFNERKRNVFTEEKDELDELAQKSLVNKKMSKPDDGNRGKRIPYTSSNASLNSMEVGNKKYSPDDLSTILDESKFMEDDEYTISNEVKIKPDNKSISSARLSLQNKLKNKTTNSLASSVSQIDNITSMSPATFNSQIDSLNIIKGGLPISPISTVRGGQLSPGSIEGSSQPLSVTASRMELLAKIKAKKNKKLRNPILNDDQSIDDSTIVTAQSLSRNLAIKDIDKSPFDVAVLPSKPTSATIREPLKSSNDVNDTQSMPSARSTRSVIEKSQARRLNHALLFIKPNAVHQSCHYVVTSTFDANHMKVVSSGYASGQELDFILDKQFGRVRAFSQCIPSDYVISPVYKSKFETSFGIEWQTAIDKNLIYNAKDACKSFKITHSELYNLWTNSDVIKIAKGLYVIATEDPNYQPTIIDPISQEVASPKRSSLFPGKTKKVEPVDYYVEKVPLIYIVNGFYPSMRDSYVNETIEYMIVEWDSSAFNWKEFMDDIIGNRDPSIANRKSMRGMIYNDWENLGLKTQPSLRDNSIYASCSAFEGMVDRLIWVKGTILFTDLYGIRLLASQISSQLIKEWAIDNPMINYKFITEHMDRLDSDGCIIMCNKLEKILRTVPQPTKEKIKNVIIESIVPQNRLLRGLPSLAPKTPVKIIESSPFKVIETSETPTNFKTIDDKVISESPDSTNFKVIDDKDVSDVVPITPGQFGSSLELGDSIILDTVEKSVYSTISKKKETIATRALVSNSSTLAKSAAEKALSTTYKPITSIASKRDKAIESTFFFIKPCICTPIVLNFIGNILEQHEIRVVRRGKSSAREMQVNNIVGKQYSTLMRNAEVFTPEEISITTKDKRKFYDAYEVEWHSALDDGLIVNAKDMCTELTESYAELYERWQESPMMIRISRGFYIAKIEYEPNAIQIAAFQKLHAQKLFEECDGKQISRYSRHYKFDPPPTPPSLVKYVVNGFYGGMRDSFYGSNANLEYMTLEWDCNKYNWTEFQSKVIGNRDFNLADPSSIRGALFEVAKELHIDKKFVAGENLCHSSLSGFESMLERLLWIKGSILFTDIFGSKMIKARIPSNISREWSKNPVVKGKILSHHMENKNSDDCVNILLKLLDKDVDVPLRKVLSTDTETRQFIQEKEKFSHIREQVRPNTVHTISSFSHIDQIRDIDDDDDDLTVSPPRSAEVNIRRPNKVANNTQPLNKVVVSTIDNSINDTTTPRNVIRKNAFGSPEISPDKSDEDDEESNIDNKVNKKVNKTDITTDMVGLFDQTPVRVIQKKPTQTPALKSILSSITPKSPMQPHYSQLFGSSISSPSHDPYANSDNISISIRSPPNNFQTSADKISPDRLFTSPKNKDKYLSSFPSPNKEKLNKSDTHTIDIDNDDPFFMDW
jgi:hypothetical protein